MISVKDLSKELGMEESVVAETGTVNDENAPAAPVYCKRISLSDYEREGREYTKKALLDLVKAMKADKEKLGKRALRSKKKNFAAGLKALISSVVGAGAVESEEERKRVAEEVDNLCDQILMTHFYYNGSSDASSSPDKAVAKTKQKQPAAAASSVPKPPPLPAKLPTQVSTKAPRARPQISFLQDIKNLQNAQRVQATKKITKKPMGTPTRPNFLSEISGSARKLRKTPLPRSPGGTPARQKPRRSSSAMASALEVAIAKRFSKIQVDSPMSDASDFE